MDLEIKKLAEIIYRPQDEALILLISYQWKVDKIQSSFFNDTDKFLKDSGLLVSPSTISKKSSTKTCSICCEESRNMMDLLCGHLFCRGCMIDYVNSKIQNREFLIGCMSSGREKCKILLYPSLVKSLLTPNNKKNFDKIQLTSFLVNNPNLKCCPAPACKFTAEKKGIHIGVKCLCGNNYCVKCGAEDHSPASCETYKEWRRLTDKDDQMNTDWLLYNTMICPHCKARVNRDKGCNYMACTCGHQFCYECGRPWKPDHKDTYEGHFNCPTPPPAKTKETMKTAESRFNYNKHYFDLWETQMAQIRLAQDMLDKRADEMVQEFTRASKLEMNQCIFLKKAVEDLLVSRRVLANSFIYGHGLGVSPKKGFFEFIQDDLRRLSDQLAEMLQQDVKAVKRDAVINLSHLVLDQSNSLNELLLKGF